MTQARVLAGALVAALVVGACGGDDAGDGPGISPTTPPSGSTAAAPANPEALAQAIYDDFVAMNRELATLLAGQDSAAQLKPKVTELKDRYIEKFVAAGRKRASMNPTDASKVESEVRRLLFTPPTIDVSAMNSAVQRFGRDEPDLAKQITSLNILTQYAFFELLKKQEPEEARRLGIE